MPEKNALELEIEINELKEAIKPKIQAVRDEVKNRLAYLRSQLHARKKYEATTANA